MHRYQLRNRAHANRHLQSAWNRDGEEAFEFNVLITCSKKSLLSYEQMAFDSVNPEYNIQRVAGSSLGVPCSDETKKKIGLKNKGRVWTPESKAKLILTTTGRKLSEERRATLIGNKRAKGYKHTEEWKLQNSIRNTGFKRPKSAEYRAKISASLKGRKATPEHRANQAAAQRGLKRKPYVYKNKQKLPEVIEV